MNNNIEVMTFEKYRETVKHLGIKAAVHGLEEGYGNGDNDIRTTAQDWAMSLVEDKWFDDLNFCGNVISHSKNDFAHDEFSDYKKFNTNNIAWFRDTARSAMERDVQDIKDDYLTRKGE